MNRTITVKNCVTGCPFAFMDTQKQPAPYCTHPFWIDKPAGANQIIAGIHRNDGVFPERCPLRKESLTETYSLGQVKE